MSILVTGGKGFIGSRVIKKLLERKESVVCMELKTTPGRLGDMANQIVMVEGDVARFDDIMNVINEHKIKKIAHVVYFSAEERGQGKEEQPDELYRQMLIMNLGTFNIYEAARIAGIKRLLYPSSIAYHGDPVTFEDVKPLTEDSPSNAVGLYGIGKHLVEVLADEYNRMNGMEITIVRIPMVYGPGVRVGARGSNLIAVQGGLGKPVLLPYAKTQMACPGSRR